MVTAAPLITGRRWEKTHGICRQPCPLGKRRGCYYMIKSPALGLPLRATVSSKRGFLPRAPPGSLTPSSCLLSSRLSFRTPASAHLPTILSCPPGAQPGGSRAKASIQDQPALPQDSSLPPSLSTPASTLSPLSQPVLPQGLQARSLFSRPLFRQHTSARLPLTTLFQMQCPPHTSHFHTTPPFLASFFSLAPLPSLHPAYLFMECLFILFGVCWSPLECKAARKQETQSFVSLSIS